ncbi:MAG: 50S ribosomal protein L2 [Nanoarchaeota archaeon]|nr:50S ribosomal protein L2 [Nanoarchaeota archaeon]
MGKRIIQQARGKGSLTYRVRKKAFKYRVGYPSNRGEAEIVKIIHSAAHSAPLIKTKVDEKIFFNVAFTGAFEGQKIMIGGNEPGEGNIIILKEIPIATKIFNIERNPGDGGKMIRTAGISAVVYKKYENNEIGIIMPNKKEVKLNENCRATIGIVAGEGIKQKPFMKAGKMFHKKKAKSKLWPRVSAVCMNAVDHPFGSGRGKRIKSKIAKRNAPPGRKVGHLRPKKTGKKR